MNEVSNAMLCLLGIGTVFVGLVSIIVMCWVVSAIVRWTSKETQAPAAKKEETVLAEARRPEAADTHVKIAITAALAEYLGTDFTSIQIVSIEKTVHS